jgi:hypothetical protein
MLNLTVNFIIPTLIGIGIVLSAYGVGSLAGYVIKQLRVDVATIVMVIGALLLCWFVGNLVTR